ncbi:5-demethoxyubiquinone hydroxylase, mitochondrial isoform X2 [Teleopsis dalmanni]|uniref:5-demethoxyubiquinone hydroxylase, mitochondrial isoform X2 n=1 Tax=Teleopsis dalmanni TaxID=139649 RepID=UPI0018CEBCD6|nr:5-demethoxyubiquinone hydroxylase, mitochondrial isoform X2 [Teleopsis dalmanni]
MFKIFKFRVIQIELNVHKKSLHQKMLMTSHKTKETKPNIQKRPSSLTDEIIRVDHAGELGADRIYAGQLAVLGNSPMSDKISHMWEQEKCHRQQFEKLIREHRVRPTVMTPIWNVAGFLLGAALMGEKAAMACTVAVETTIVEHYNDQLRKIMETDKPDKELLKVITKFRDEEQEHHDTGIEHGAEQAPFYETMTTLIKYGCKAAIAISKKI